MLLQLIQERYIMLKKVKYYNNQHTAFQIIITGFLLIILAGALLLMLPVSSQSHTFTKFSDTLFTAVSATCVTGLVVKDTATHWSMFGQMIILILIQIGGMGVITIAVTIMRVSGKKIGLWQRSTMRESISAPQIGGIVRLTGFILKVSAITELTGTIMFMPVFCREFGLLKGLWYSLFHSVSAFCNAGFDLMGIKSRFSSLCSYNENIYINIIVMFLIVSGGIGFITWNDIREHHHHIKYYSMQSKIILLTSSVLILLPAVYFFFCEYPDLPVKSRIISSLFQSVTTRTAGFNTTDLAQMTESGNMIMIVLMLIGGSPGSTAGGMKTTTVAVLFLSAVAVFGRKNDVQCFKRRLPEDAVRNAGAILFIYISLFITGAIIISRIENLPLITCLFETGSAIGTVGLTLGITSTLSMTSRIILMILMFLGRVGGLTLIYAVLPSGKTQNSRLPLEKITVG